MIWSFTLYYLNIIRDKNIDKTIHTQIHKTHIKFIWKNYWNIRWKRHFDCLALATYFSSIKICIYIESDVLVQIISDLYTCTHVYMISNPFASSREGCSQQFSLYGDLNDPIVWTREISRLKPGLCARERQLGNQIGKYRSSRSDRFFVD